MRNPKAPHHHLHNFLDSVSLQFVELTLYYFDTVQIFLEVSYIVNLPQSNNPDQTDISNNVGEGGIICNIKPK